MTEERKAMWPRSWDGVIVWFRPNEDGGETPMFWSVPEQSWKRMNRPDAIMYSDDATEDELVAAGLNPQDFK